MLTLDGVGLGQLTEIGYELLGNGFPCPTLWETEVDMSTGELVDVKLRPSDEKQSIMRWRKA